MDSNKCVKNPWGRGKISLKKKTLSNHEKLYLAQLVNSDNQTCAEVANKYSISKSVVAKYAQSVRNDLILHTGAGQPPAIDAISSGVLVDFLSNNAENLNIKNCKSLVSKACQDSYSRRSNDNLRKCKAYKVSARTIRKYAVDFMGKSSKKI